jgi:hypothetical protein
MRIRTLIFTTLLCLAAGAGTAAAQEPGKVGLTIAHPSAVGLIWHASDRLAVRPEFTFSLSSSENRLGGGLPGGSSSDSTSVGTGVSVLFYTHQWDRVRGYVAPRFGYSRTKSKNEQGTFSSELTSTTYAWSGAYGVQFMPTDRFSIFGEVGIGGAFGRGKASNSGNTSEGHSWGTRSGIGMAVYF